MTNIRIEYTANNGTAKVLDDVENSGFQQYKQHFTDKPTKYFQINRDGQYDLLQVCCRGKCNTYWRTVGRYPKVIVAKNVMVPTKPAPEYSEQAYNDAVQALAEQCVAMAREDYSDADEIKFHAAEYCGDTLQDLNTAIQKLLK